MRMANLKSLIQDQFDRKLPQLQETARALAMQAPSSGWIQTIRQVLGMSSSALAKRLGIAHTGLLKLEKGERAGTVSLATLRRAADALDADFVYALVPRKTVRDTVRARAQQLAQERVLPVANSMQLEAQGLSAEQLKRRIDELASDLEMRPRELWR
jgi:predicted DNA-binding mobile mystery protein A